MIKRIVKLTFRKEETAAFLAIFDRSSPFIRQFPGCSHLELWRSEEDERIFFTYSFWQDAEALENYRRSDLFQTTWAQTKILFAEKPEAWSVKQLA